MSEIVMFQKISQFKSYCLCLILAKLNNILTSTDDMIKHMITDNTQIKLYSLLKQNDYFNFGKMHEKMIS